MLFDYCDAQSTKLSGKITEEFGAEDNPSALRISERESDVCMSDRMTPIPFHQLLTWMFAEFRNSRSIFGIPSAKFFHKRSEKIITVCHESLETPLGPAAGPHTQLAQNIIVSYLTGGRFFELKTVQQLDELHVDKPCIDAQDEGYNVEWSQELTLAQSYEEYLKAWFALHLLKQTFGLSSLDARGFVFNMSVGYTLDGIRTGKMNQFIDAMKDASSHPLFNKCRSTATHLVKEGAIAGMEKSSATLEELLQNIDSVSPLVTGSVTLSTMHGCPPQEIEAITKYLIKEKQLHTFVKLNPTLLGYNDVKTMLQSLGYGYIHLEEESFSHDLQFGDAIPMLRRLKEFAAAHGKEFGVKLSNTLGVKNTQRVLSGDQMYMSGRALFPLTITLAHRLAKVFDGSLRISFSGGVSNNNVDKILETGIAPITLVTDLLKPGGYARMFQMAETVEHADYIGKGSASTIDLSQLQRLSETALADEEYRKEKREIESVKIPKTLEKFDCYIAPCTVACPIHQDVAQYIRLVEEERYADALEVIVSKNPLPHITGYICDHQCMNKCTRWDYDDPVKIRDLKRVAAEKGFDEYLKRFEQSVSVRKNSIRVAIVGAGPSGLAAGYFLAKSGFDATIFEQRDKPGGTVQHVIPEFRLPQSAIDDDVELIKRHGVKFEFGSAAELSVAGLKKSGFKYVYLAIGAPKSNQLHLKGENRTVVDAVEFLKAFRENKPVELGRHVAVIGGGNSAMDAARAALRTRGVETVNLIYRRTKEFMPADKEEFDAAVREGTIFKELLLPVEFDGVSLRCQKMKLGDPDLDGRRKVVAIENAIEAFEIDTVVSAIGENVDKELLKRNLIPLNDREAVQVNAATNETMVENVYIGGDALRGPSTVVESIADGKKAAEAIILKERLNIAKEENFDSMIKPHKRIESLNKSRGTILPTLSDDPDAFLSQREASRCLGCSFICDKCVDVCPNRANISIPTLATEGGFKNIAQILHVEALCNECGNCETFCPYTEGSPYKSKTTLFWTEKDLLESTNDGFYVDGTASAKNHFTATVRFNNEVGSIVCDARGTLLHGSIPIPEKQTEFQNFTRLIAIVVKQHSYLLPSLSQ